MAVLITSAVIGAQDKGTEYTLVIPAQAIQAEGRSMDRGLFGGGVNIYGVDLRSDTAWDGSLPHVETTGFEKKGRKDDLIEYEFRTSERWMKLRIPSGALLEQYAVEGSAVDDAALVLTNAALKLAGARALSKTDISADLWEKWRDMSGGWAADTSRHRSSFAANRIWLPIWSVGTTPTTRLA